LDITPYGSRCTSPTHTAEPEVKSKKKIHHYRGKKLLKPNDHTKEQIFILKGQAHKKVGEIRSWDVSLGPK
jgi:hypothetical protein